MWSPMREVAPRETAWSPMWGACGVVGEAGEVDMRNVGGVASDHACDQKPRRERRKKGEKEIEKRELFLSPWPITHFCHDAKIRALTP